MYIRTYTCLCSCSKQAHGPQAVFQKKVQTTYSLYAASSFIIRSWSVIINMGFDKQELESILLPSTTFK